MPITLLGRANCIADGRAQLDQLDPDRVVRDVARPAGTGFDLLEFLRDRDFLGVVMTGLDQYAIRALRYAAFDYLQKPVLARSWKTCCVPYNASNAASSRATGSTLLGGGHPTFGHAVQQRSEHRRCG